MYALQVSSHSGEVCKIFSFELIGLLHILFKENKKKKKKILETMQWPADIIGAPMPGLIMPANC